MGTRLRTEDAPICHCMLLWLAILDTEKNEDMVYNDYIYDLRTKTRKKT